MPETASQQDRRDTVLELSDEIQDLSRDLRCAPGYTAHEARRDLEEICDELEDVAAQRSGE